MDFILVILYIAFSLALSAVQYVPENGRIPWWAGGSFTPAGACLNRLPARFAIVVFYALILLGLAGASRYLDAPDQPIFRTTVQVLGVVLFLLGILAAGLRFASMGSSRQVIQEAIGETLPNFEAFRIQASSSPEYSQICLNPEVSSQLTDTPFSFLKEIPKSSLEAALRVAPHLAYQPVHPEISKLCDDRVRTLEEEVHGHADRALTALAERDATAAELKTVKEELALLKASEDKFKQEIIALRTRARSVQQTKDYSSMNVDEIKQQRQLITEELRKLDQALRSMREGPASQAGLAGLMNPDFAPKPPQAPPPPPPPSPPV